MVRNYLTLVTSKQKFVLHIWQTLTIQSSLTLITQATQYRERVPGIKGTNIIRIFSSMKEISVTKFSDAWNMAYEVMNDKKSVPVKSTNSFPLSIGPNEVKQNMVLLEINIKFLLLYKTGGYQSV